jgi:hypothetical protein
MIVTKPRATPLSMSKLDHHAAFAKSLLRDDRRRRRVDRSIEHYPALVLAAYFCLPTVNQYAHRIPAARRLRALSEDYTYDLYQLVDTVDHLATQPDVDERLAPGAIASYRAAFDYFGETALAMNAAVMRSTEMREKAGPALAFVVSKMKDDRRQQFFDHFLADVEYYPQQFSRPIVRQTKDNLERMMRIIYDDRPPYDKHAISLPPYLLH